jgi:hypothetical protein
MTGAGGGATAESMGGFAARGGGLSFGIPGGAGLTSAHFTGTFHRSNHSFRLHAIHPTNTMLPVPHADFPGTRIASLTITRVLTLWILGTIALRVVVPRRVARGPGFPTH